MLDFKPISAPDFHKIADLLARKNGAVLVGFPGGRMHIDAKHTEQLGKDGEPKRRKDGSPVTEGGNEVTKETAVLAKELHYGTAQIPARPFLDEGVKYNADEIKAALAEEAKKEHPNWDRIGTLAVGKIQEFVRGDYYRSSVPNSRETIEAKGSDQPLIDSADMINSLTFVVEK